MFWETVAALILILGTFPIWIFVAFFWGMIRAAVTLVSVLIELSNGSAFDWSEVWLVPVVAIVEGVASAWSIPSGVWTWAKFEHPGWASIIGLISLAMLNNGSRR